MSKTLSIKEFKEGGYLQEVNRTFFHPLGLALAINWGETEEECSLAYILDSREDPEGFIFGPGMISRELMLKVQQEFVDKVETRWVIFGGSSIQFPDDTEV